jgi:hypothetical protein
MVEFFGNIKDIFKIPPSRTHTIIQQCDKVVEDGVGATTDGAVDLVGNDQIEVSRRKETPVLVVEERKCNVVTTISTRRQSSRFYLKTIFR